MLSKKNQNQAFFYEEEFNQNNESLDLNNKENNKTTIFIIGNEEISLQPEKKKLFINLIKNVYPADLKNKAYILPKWIDKPSFETFIEIYSNSQHNPLATKLSNSNTQNAPQTKKLIEIAIYFQDYKLAQIIVEDYITPNLDKNSCLQILHDYMEYIYNEAYRNVFLNLIHICIGIAANNIFFLVNNKHEELFSIAEDSLEEIFERYFESVFFNNSIDHSLLMRLMIEFRKLNDIYELLENERKRAINIFDKLYLDGLDPTIIWNIKSDEPAAGFYKESEEFEFEKISLIMINYYDAQKDVYNMAIKITDLREANIINNNNNNKNTTNNNSESDSQINFQQHATAQQPNQFIVSILSICEIPEINYKSKINFNCIFSNTKSKVLVFKIEHFSKMFEKFEEIDFSMKIYFMISYNFSSILTHICKNFYEYYSLNSISKISRNVLNIILKNEILNVQHEDEVLHAVINWINNKQNANIENVEELIKNINWSNVSLDGLLDFIINQSKILMASTLLQNILISEFSRRFKEEYAKELNTSPDRKLLTNGSNNPMWNLNNATSNSNFKQYSFTSDLVFKLIKIASKYETTNKSAVNLNSSSLNNQSQNSNLQSKKILSNTNKAMNNNSSIKNFNFHEDSKISLIVNVVNTSPSTSLNKNFLAVTPPPEPEKPEKIKEINQTRDFNLKRKIDNYTNNNNNNNISKSNKSPYNKDKFTKHLKAASNNLTNFNKESNSNPNNNNNYNNININYKNQNNLFDKNNDKNNNFNNLNSENLNNNLNAKSLSIISENSNLKRKIFQNNFLAQSKGERNYKENYKSENELANNVSNINRTKTPNTRSLNRDFSENVVYSNKIKPKNNLNYTNRENTLHVLSDRDRKQIPASSGNTVIIPNQLNHNNTLSNLSNISKNNKSNSGFNSNYKNNNNNNNDNNSVVNNKNNSINNINFMDKKQTGSFNYGVKTPSVHQSPYGNNSNSNNSTKNKSNNNNNSSGVYQFKANPLYHNSIINKSLNANINNNSISLNANNSISNNNNNLNFNNNENHNSNSIKDLLGNNMNLSLNLNGRHVKNISTDKKLNSQTIDNHKGEQERMKESIASSNFNKNGLISYMKPRACEIFKAKQNDSIIKSKFTKKDGSRPKSATGVRSLLKK